MREEQKSLHDSVVPELLGEIEKLRVESAEHTASGLKEKVRKKLSLRLRACFCFVSETQLCFRKLW